MPEMTPVIAEFSKLPLGKFQESWDFIKAHRDVVVPGASDALLVAGYRAQREGKAKYAKQCVHQSLLLQYGEKLGKDGISVFFSKYVFISVHRLEIRANLSLKDHKGRSTRRSRFHEGRR